MAPAERNKARPSRDRRWRALSCRFGQRAKRQTGQRHFPGARAVRLLSAAACDAARRIASWPGLMRGASTASCRLAADFDPLGARRACLRRDYSAPGGNVGRILIPRIDPTPPIRPRAALTGRYLGSVRKRGNADGVLAPGNCRIEISRGLKGPRLNGG